MFDFDSDSDSEGSCYYIRFGQEADSLLNLLFVPVNGVEGNQSLMHLFREYADPNGIVAYYDPAACCIISLRARELQDLRVYLYDEIAPYDGFYLDGRFIEALEDI